MDKAIQIANQVESAAYDASVLLSCEMPVRGMTTLSKKEQEHSSSAGNQRQAEAKSVYTHANATDVTQISTWQTPQNVLLQTKHANHVERLDTLQKCAAQVKKTEVRETVMTVLLLKDAVPAEKKIMCNVEVGKSLKKGAHLR